MLGRRAATDVAYAYHQDPIEHFSHSFRCRLAIYRGARIYLNYP
jgi:hypothetical protein